MCVSLLHGQYIHILVICQILSELMCFEDLIIKAYNQFNNHFFNNQSNNQFNAGMRRGGGQRQAICWMSKIACHIDHYKETVVFTKYKLWSVVL